MHNPNAHENPGTHHDEAHERRMVELRRAEAVAQGMRAAFAADPNVLALGYGRRLRKGEITEDLVVTFHVREKVETDEEMYLLGTRRIPAEIDGVPTDVVAARQKRHASGVGDRDKKSFDPLVGGLVTSNADNHTAFWNSWGTLGTLCFDKSTGAPMALSNWHVWAADGGDSGDTIIQPGHPTAGDYAEAGAKFLLCGPILTHLFDWNAPSPLTGGLAAAAAAAWIAAAAADDADPTRRGQLATPPADDDELTVRERVDAVFDSLQDPLPGTPFKVGAHWKYTRTTEARDYTFAVDEVRRNEHVLVRKQLWSAVQEYRGGSRVELLARLVTLRARHPEDYHVVAQIVSPAEDRKLSVVLHPAACPERDLPTCISFRCDRPGAVYGRLYPRAAATFVAPPGRLNRVVDRLPGEGPALVLYERHEVKLPPTREVEVTVVPVAGTIEVEAFSGPDRVAVATTRVAPLTPQKLILATDGGAIESLRFVGGFKAALLLEICYREESDRQRSVPAVADRSAEGVAEVAIVERTFCYRGGITLDLRAEPGCWKCYLYVQTVNNVPLGTDPAIAAQTIGGLPAAQNMTTQPAADGGGCALCMILDHVFHVI